MPNVACLLTDWEEMSPFYLLYQTKSVMIQHTVNSNLVRNEKKTNTVPVIKIGRKINTPHKKQNILFGTMGPVVFEVTAMLEFQLEKKAINIEEN